MTLTKPDMVWLLALVIAPFHGGISTTLLGLLVIYAAGKYFMGSKTDYMVAARLVSGIFLLYFAYFFIISAWHAHSLVVGYKAMKGNLPILGMAAYGLVVQQSSHQFSTKNIGKWATYAVLITVACAAILYCLNFFILENTENIYDKVWYGKTRLRMFSRNPLMFASMLLSVSCLTLLGFEYKKLSIRIVSIAALFLGWGVVFFMAQSRGAFICAVFLIVLILWYIKTSMKIIIPIIICCTLLFFIMYFSLDWFSTLVDAFLQRFEAMMAQLLDTNKVIENNTQTRIIMYKKGIDAALDAPWFGYGYQNRFQAIVPLLSSEYTGWLHHGHIHNAFLNHAVAGGIFGLFFFCTLLFLPFWLLYRFQPTNRDEKYLAWVIVVVMSGIGMTTAILGHYVHSNFYGALIMTLALVLSRNRQSPPPPPPTKQAIVG